MNGDNDTISPSPEPRAAPPSRLRLFHIRLYGFSEFATELLIYFVLAASPWMFGTTQTWSIHLMNTCGFVLGGLLAVKLFIRRFRGYQPPRWIGGNVHPTVTRITYALALLTGLILGYCLISALNYRSVWQRTTNTFDFHPFIAWLPHSYDRASTLRVFWNYAAMACVFWAIRDWLLGADLAEAQTRRSVRRTSADGNAPSSFLPSRLRRLLWVLSINGGLLAAEGIAQRLSGTNKLLWLIEPYIHKDTLSQFGPYTYRSNAAQYFNLLWPAVLGFWWTLHRSRGFRRWRHHWLLVCGALMAACPIIATTRGGAFVTGGLVFFAGLFLAVSPLFFRSSRRFSPKTAIVTGGVIVGFFAVALWLGLHFGWSSLEPRMTEVEAGYEQREHMYQTARQMARDYRAFGTGPGTFDPLFQLYRTSTDEYWPAQLHNDWLETRITFGLIGSALIAMAFALVIGRWFVPGGIHGGRRFVVLVWMGLAGCMVHARFDYPFQVYSILLLFLALCAVLATVTRRGGAS